MTSPNVPLLQFGEIDIDSELVTARDTLADGEQQIMMLNNGCLCCTVRDDLVKMLGELVSPAAAPHSYCVHVILHWVSAL